MIHKMKLQRIPFELILSGKKKYEFRLFDEKRKMISIGDHIIFSWENYSVTTKVTEIITAKTWEELERKIDADGKGDNTPLGEMMRGYYSDNDESLYGCIAIGIEVVDLGFLSDAQIKEKR